MSYGYLEKKSNNEIVLCGEVHFDNVETLYKSGLKFLKALPAIMIDLGGVKSGDSTLLALCISWIRAAKLQDTKLQFINMPEFMQDVVKVYEVDKVLKWAN